MDDRALQTIRTNPTNERARLFWKLLGRRLVLRKPNREFRDKIFVNIQRSGRTFSNCKDSPIPTPINGEVREKRYFRLNRKGTERLVWFIKGVFELSTIRTYWINRISFCVRIFCALLFLVWQSGFFPSPTFRRVVDFVARSIVYTGPVGRRPMAIAV